MPRLTKAQYEILKYADAYIEEHGKAPTIREIAGYFGYNSPNSAFDQLMKLEEKGYIERACGKPRNIKILHLPENPNTELPDRQARILQMIMNSIEAEGLCPSYADLADHEGISVSAIKQILSRLEKTGYIKKSSKCRATQVLKNPEGHPVQLRFERTDNNGDTVQA